MRSSQLDGARRTLEADANKFSRDTAKGKANPLGAEMLRQGVALIDAIQQSCSDPEAAKKSLAEIAVKLKTLSE
jgi:hypothetical protein